MKKKLAVVVPMYNVELFLAEALDSLLRQGLKAEEMQVILIDDGSIDRTPEIAKTYVQRYPEFFEVHEFENVGLGAARNRGTRLANAEYITYVDSDDIVVENSYQKALKILSETGSQILIGGTKRFNSEKIWNSIIHSKAVFEDKRKTTLEESPELIWDTTSWNKIYNLDFIRENSLYFLEGMLYEDLPTVTPALALASSIDVMVDTMYLWRVRDIGKPSITQLSSNDTSGILDRLKANASVMSSLKRLNIDQHIIYSQAKKFLDFDTLMMFRKHKYSLFSDVQKAELFDALKSYLNLFSLEQISVSKFEMQGYYKRILEIDSQEEFDKLTLSFLRNETNYYGEWRDDEYILTSSLSDSTKIATADDFNVHTRIEEVIFSDNHLILKGYAFAEYSDMSRPELIKHPHINLLDENNQVVAENVGTINFFKNKDITAKFGYNKNHFVKDGADFNYDYSAYEISIPLIALTQERAHLKVSLNFVVDNQALTVMISKPVVGEKTRPKTKISEQLHAAYDITYNTCDWSLNIKPILDIAILSVENSIYKLINVNEEVYLKQGKTKLPLIKFGDELHFPHIVSKRLSSYEKDGRGDWNFMTIKNGKEKPLYFGQNIVRLSHPTFFKTLSAENGQARLAINWYCPEIKSVCIEEETLIIEFELYGWEREAAEVSVVADPKLPEIVWTTEKLSNRGYRLVLPLTLDGFGEKEWLNFQVLMKFSDGYQTMQKLKWGDHPFELEGQIISVGGVGWEFRRIIRNGGGFAIKRTADRLYRKKEGSFERFLEIEYSGWLQAPLLENYIMMSSYWGQDNQFNDNPEALYHYVSEHYPNMTTIIMLKDAIRSYPEYPNAKVVSYGTKEYWYYLARAKYFVNNVNYTEPQRVKREGQVEVQTMHGTPLKTLGFEVLEDWTDMTYDAILRKNQNWDYLLTPSDWVTEYAKKVFAVSPKVINSGYPRNDKLFKQHSQLEIDEIKISLNLPLDKKIILYAPTWRTKGTTPIDAYLDVKAFYSAIPDDTLVVLKCHHFEKWTELGSEYADKFIYSDNEATIEDLYLLSDALITDYSSVMFDYILLKKPMIFYSFDYETYVEGRGINFDFKNEAPGPFVEKQDDLHQWLSRYSSIAEEFSKNITNFEHKFVQYDKGNACEQVISQILGDNK